MAQPTPTEQRRLFREGFERRMGRLADIAERAVERTPDVLGGMVKEEIFGLPGLLGDLAEPASAIMNPTLYATNPEIREGVSKFQKEFGAEGLARAAGFELSDEFFDDEGNFRDEMFGRLLAPGSLYLKGAALLPELSRGVQGLVSGLKNEGFFPPGGPQPALVGGPSSMAQVPDDAGPRSTVLMSEAQGTPTGGEKSLVQAEKEDRFVSSDNPAVDLPPESALSMGAGENKVEIPGMSTTGVYLPVKAALDNIDIPAGGITGTKLLERLRGQPRTGRELTSSGFSGFLKNLGDQKITKESAKAAYDGMRNKLVSRVVMSNDFKYGDAVSPGEGISYLGMQRQIGAKDTERNYGILLFGDEAGKIDGTPIETVGGHQYFTDNLPGHFGHLRFSIQEILDPKTNQPIKALLVEEIQSDLVRAFGQVEQIRRGIPSLEKIKKEIAATSGSTDQAWIEQMANDQLQDRMDQAVREVNKILGDRIPYGPEQKLADATLRANPNVSKYEDMVAKYRFAEDSNEVLSKPQMSAVERSRDTYREMEADANGRAGAFKTLLISGVHKANSRAEAEDAVNRISDRVLNAMPLTPGQYRKFSNLDQTEKLVELRQSLLEDWDRANKEAVARVPQQRTGLMSLFKNKDIADQLAEHRRKELVQSLKFQVQQRHRATLSDRLARRLSDQFKEALLKPPAEGDDIKEVFDRLDLDASSPTLMKKAKDATATPVRALVPRDEIKKILTDSGDVAETEITNAADALDTELRSLKAADPVFADVDTTYYGGKPITDTRSLVDDLNLYTNLGGYYMQRFQQANIYRDNVLKMVEEAKNVAPSKNDLASQLDRVLDDEGVGAVFREKYQVDPNATGKDIVQGDFLDLMQGRDAEDYINVPPFETQNDFIQYATRALMHEAKKMDVDAVVMPSVEEMILGREGHIMGGLEPDQKIQNIESMKKTLAGEKRLREVKAKLQQLSKETDEILTAEDFEKAGILEDMKTAFSFDSLNYSQYILRGRLGMNANEYLKYLTPDGIKSIAKEKYAGLPNAYIVDERKLRGHFQNSGEALDAALNGLVKEGFDISELERLSAKTQDGSKYVSIGGYAQQGKSDLAKYRMIDLRKGTKGSDVAKKVPSLYNKGGHVDIRGGIGAMARSVM